MRFRQSFFEKLMFFYKVWYVQNIYTLIYVCTFFIIYFSYVFYVSFCQCTVCSRKSFVLKRIYFEISFNFIQIVIVVFVLWWTLKSANKSILEFYSNIMTNVKVSWIFTWKSPTRKFCAIGGLRQRSVSSWWIESNYITLRHTHLLQGL